MKTDEDSSLVKYVLDAWPFKQIRESLGKRKLMQECLDEIVKEAVKQDIIQETLRKDIQQLVVCYLTNKGKPISNNTTKALESLKRRGIAYSIDFYIQGKKDCPIPDSYINEPIGVVRNPEWLHYYSEIERFENEIIQKQTEFHRKMVESYWKQLEEWKRKKTEKELKGLLEPLLEPVQPIFEMSDSYVSLRERDKIIREHGLKLPAIINFPVYIKITPNPKTRKYNLYTGVS